MLSRFSYRVDLSNTMVENSTADIIDSKSVTLCTLLYEETDRKRHKNTEKKVCYECVKVKDFTLHWCPLLSSCCSLLSHSGHCAVTNLTLNYWNHWNVSWSDWHSQWRTKDRKQMFSLYSFPRHAFSLCLYVSTRNITKSECIVKIELNASDQMCASGSLWVFFFLLKWAVLMKLWMLVKFI